MKIIRNVIAKLMMITILTLGLSSVLQAQSPVIGNIKSSIESFVPKNWKIMTQEKGDMNKDGVDDQVIVIEDTNPINIKTNDGLGSNMLNLNPRTLLLLFKVKNGFQLVAQNNKGFIPSQNDEESTCLADPLLQDGGIDIERGILKISLNYWYSCGSWSVNNALYSFRYQNKNFELIGFDYHDFHRSSGEETAMSINYSTGKKATTTGGNMFNDDQNKPKTTWQTFKKVKSYNLTDCNEQTYFDITEFDK